jgi:hypothetical protein
MAKQVARNSAADDARQLMAPADPVPEMGVCMRALPARWRAAVEALFVTEGDMTKAAQIAGYKADNRESLRVMAHRIFRDNRVRAAIQEEAKKHIDISEPELISTVKGILRNPVEKAADRLRAASMIWDRSNPVVTKHKIEVEHHLTDAERDVRHYYALKKLGAPHDAFINRFGPNGLARVEELVRAEEAKQRQIEGDTIDADFVDVTATTDAREIPAAAADNPTDNGPDFEEDLL